MKKGGNETASEFNAAEYCQEVIEAMRADPGNCELHQRLAEAVDSPWAVFPGPTGGSLSLAIATLTEIQKIHRPKCKLYPR